MISLIIFRITGIDQYAIVVYQKYREVIAIKEKIWQNQRSRKQQISDKFFFFINKLRDRRVHKNIIKLIRGITNACSELPLKSTPNITL